MQLTQVTQETISFCMFTATIFTGQPGPQRCSLYLILYIFWLMKHLKAVNTCLLDLVLLFFFLLPPAVGSINLLCHMLDIHCILYYTRVAQLSNLCGFLWIFVLSKNET